MRPGEGMGRYRAYEPVLFNAEFYGGGMRLEITRVNGC